MLDRVVHPPCRVDHASYNTSIEVHHPFKHSNMAKVASAGGRL